MKIIYYLSNFILRLNLRIQANWSVEGNINIPKNGPLIIVCNHQSNFDPPLVAASVPKRRTWFLAKSELFNGPKIAKMFLRAYGGFPLHKGKSDLNAYKWALKKLKSGEAIVIFPEGKRNPRGLGKPFLGAARIALKSGAPVLPIAITGTENLISWTTVFRPKGTLNVKIGKIIKYEKNTNKQKTIQDEATYLTELMMSQIAKLLPEEYRGIYRSNH